MQLTPTYVIPVPKNKRYVYNISQYAQQIIPVKNNAKYWKSKKKKKSIAFEKKKL